MATLQTETCALKASAASGGTVTMTMDEGHWEIANVTGYLTANATGVSDITVSVNGAAVSGVMRMADGTALANTSQAGEGFGWDLVVVAPAILTSLYQGDVITVTNVGTANVTFIHLRRK
jgi:hypothetical protein